MKLVIQGAVIFALSGLAMFGLSHFSKQSNSYLIYGAVLKYIDARESKVPGAVYYVQVEGQDPSPELRNELQSARFKVEPWSSLPAGEGAHLALVKNPQNGRQAQAIRLERITWPEANQPVVHAGKDIYVLKRPGQEWQVDFHGAAGGQS